MNSLKPGRNIPNKLWNYNECKKFVDESKPKSVIIGRCGRVRAGLRGKRVNTGPARCFIMGDPIALEIIGIPLV